MRNKLRISLVFTFVLIFISQVVLGINENEKIIFVSYEPGNSEIMIMNPDGTNRVNLTQNDHHDVLPHISPDGKMIVYYCHEEEAIKTMNLDGSDKAIVLKANNLVNGPRWSPDGTKIAYMSFDDDLSSSNLFIFDLLTGEINQITDQNYYSCLPAWSPDGEKIAYVANPKGNFELFVIHLATGEEQLLVTLTESIHDIEPLPLSWSPDGERLAFAKEFNGMFDVCVIELNGKKLINLTNSDKYHDYAPSWSPCGTKIAFVSMRNNKEDIYVMTADGSQINRITEFEGNNKYPIWFSIAE